MTRKNLEYVFGAVFLVTLFLIWHDSRLPARDPMRWLSGGVGRVVAWSLFTSAIGYLTARHWGKRKAE